MSRRRGSFTEKVEGEDGKVREMVVAEAIKRISERATRRISGMAGRIALQRHADSGEGLEEPNGCDRQG